MIVKKCSHQKLHQYKINNLRLNLNDVGFRGRPSVTYGNQTGDLYVIGQEH